MAASLHGLPDKAGPEAAAASDLHICRADQDRARCRYAKRGHQWPQTFRQENPRSREGRRLSKHRVLFRLVPAPRHPEFHRAAYSMVIMKYLPHTIIGSYLLIGIMTFGHAFNADYRVSESKFVSSDEINSSRSLMCAICWPLYWSVQLTKDLRPTQKGVKAAS